LQEPSGELQHLALQKLLPLLPTLWPEVSEKLAYLENIYESSSSVQTK